MSDNKYFEINIPIDVENYADFNPTRAGYSQCTPGNIPAGNVFPDFFMHYVVSGKGVVTINGVSHTIHAGEVFIFHPYQTCQYIADREDPWYYIWIGFSGNIAKKFLVMDQILPFDEPQLFFNIRDSINITSYRTEYLYAQLLLIYRKLAPSINHTTSYPEIIRHQICSSYMTPLTVNSLAAYCNIHRNYAAKLFKEAYGISISDFITQYRMQRALEFLTQGYSVEVTAANVGYPDYATFSKKFKSFFGVSPSAYKSKISAVAIGTDKFILPPAPKLEDNIFYHKK